MHVIARLTPGGPRGLLRNSIVIFGLCPGRTHDAKNLHKPAAALQALHCTYKDKTPKECICCAARPTSATQHHAPARLIEHASRCELRTPPRTPYGPCGQETCLPQRRATADEYLLYRTCTPYPTQLTQRAPITHTSTLPCPCIPACVPYQDIVTTQRSYTLPCPLWRPLCHAIAKRHAACYRATAAEPGPAASGNPRCAPRTAPRRPSCQAPSPFSRATQQQANGGLLSCPPQDHTTNSLPAQHSLRSCPRTCPSAHPPSSPAMNTPSMVVHRFLAMPVPMRNTAAYGAPKRAPQATHCTGPGRPSPQHRLHMHTCGTPPPP